MGSSKAVAVFAEERMGRTAQADQQPGVTPGVSNAECPSIPSLKDYFRADGGNRELASRRSAEYFQCLHKTKHLHTEVPLICRSWWPLSVLWSTIKSPVAGVGVDEELFRFVAVRDAQRSARPWILRAPTWTPGAESSLVEALLGVSPDADAMVAEADAFRSSSSSFVGSIEATPAIIGLQARVGVVPPVDRCRCLRRVDVPARRIRRVAAVTTGRVRDYGEHRSAPSRPTRQRRPCSRASTRSPGRYAPPEPIHRSRSLLVGQFRVVEFRIGEVRCVEAAVAEIDKSAVVVGGIAASQDLEGGTDEYEVWGVGSDCSCRPRRTGVSLLPQFPVPRNCRDGSLLAARRLGLRSALIPTRRVPMTPGRPFSPQEDS